MYNSFRQLCERVLRIPPAPEPPPGDEASTRVFRAAPNYYKYLLALWAIKSAGVILILLVVALGPLVAAVAGERGMRDAAPFVVLGFALLLGLVLLGRLFALAIVRLDFEKRWYVVTDRSLRIREGVVNAQEMTVTFANIQNISISQGPIQRVLGIADLKVDTAGGGSGATDPHHAVRDLHTAWFRGINNANEVRQLIQQRLRHLKDSGLGDHEELALPATGAASRGLIAALREVHAEAAALRQAVSRRGQ